MPRVSATAAKGAAAKGAASLMSPGRKRMATPLSSFTVFLMSTKGLLGNGTPTGKSKTPLIKLDFKQRGALNGFLWERLQEKTKKKIRKALPTLTTTLPARTIRPNSGNEVSAFVRERFHDEEFKDLGAADRVQRIMKTYNKDKAAKLQRKQQQKKRK